MKKETWDKFVHNIFYRSYGSQFTAHRIYKEEIQSFLPEKVSSNFLTEWTHYNMGGYGKKMYSWMAEDLEKIKKYLTLE